MSSNSAPLSIVLIGEVDHGKSSVVGRILQATGALPESRIAAVRKQCQEQGKEFEPAFLLDAFEEEQRQGITIDVSRVRFRTARREYRLIDAPGHREFLKNMVSGSSSAEAAILLVDAQEGLREQSRRHCYLLKLLGIPTVVVAVNKMDLVGHSEKVFDVIREEHGKYLAELGLTAAGYVPVSARNDENISSAASPMNWYRGPTLLAALDGLSSRAASVAGAPLRFAVQDVYKWDERRLVAGKVESGTIAAGQELMAWPAGRKVKVATVERWSAPERPQADAGESIALTLAEQAFLERGVILSREDARPSVTTAFDAHVFWMGKPVSAQSRLQIKLLTQETECQVAFVHQVINTETLAGDRSATTIDRHEVAEVTLRLSHPLALDRFSELAESGRFVLLQDGHVVGGGIVTEAHSAYAQIPQPTSQNISWQFSRVTAAEREARNRHAGCVVWLTGLSGSGKSTLSQLLEAELFRRGCQVYVLDGDNLRHGLNADLDFSSASRAENIRRAGEVARLFADAGHIVITAFISPFAADRAKVRRLLDTGRFFEVYLKCPLEVCEKRDAKGLYEKARAGLIPEFTGVSSPFEEPESAEVVIDSAKLPPEACAREVLACLERGGVISSSSPRGSS